MARLPSGYKELEYIKGTGTQYLDTGLTVNKSDNLQYILVAELTNNANYAGCNGYMQYQASIAGGAKAEISITYANVTETILVNGTQALSQSWSSYSGTNVKLGILRMGEVSNAWYSGSPQSGKIYSCKIKKDNVLTRDFVPCKNVAGAIGLYDLVTAAFSPNAGTGTFTAGPEVPQGPDTPQDLAAAVSDTGAVTLTWSASTGAAGYRVYRDGGLLADTTQTTVTAQLAPFGAALFAVSAYNGDGESDLASLVAYFRPGQPLLYLITDRTLADVDRIAQLAARVSAGTATDAEKTEWASDLKGAYNASDLNRVGAAVAYVAGRLNGYGYAVTVTPKQDWTVSDIPTQESMTSYLADVAALRGAIAVMASTPHTPDSASGLTWQEANNIEQILLDVDELLTRMAAAWFYSGDLYAAEV